MVIELCFLQDESEKAIVQRGEELCYVKCESAS